MRTQQLSGIGTDLSDQEIAEILRQAGIQPTAQAIAAQRIILNKTQAAVSVKNTTLQTTLPLQKGDPSTQMGILPGEAVDIGRWLFNMLARSMDPVIGGNTQLRTIHKFYGNSTTPTAAQCTVDYITPSDFSAVTGIAIVAKLRDPAHRYIRMQDNQNGVYQQDVTPNALVTSAITSFNFMFMPVELPAGGNVIRFTDTFTAAIGANDYEYDIVVRLERINR